MASSQDHNPNHAPMYPQVTQLNHEYTPPLRHSSSSPSLYPTIDVNDFTENLFPDFNGRSSDPEPSAPSAPPQSVEEHVITIPGAIIHLIDKHYSVQLATGDLRILRLRQGHDTVAMLAAVSDEIQWPLTKDVATVKLDSSHYFFSFRAPNETIDSDSSDEDSGVKKKKKKKKNKKKEKKQKEKVEEDEVLSYGLTIVSKEQQEGLLKELDGILENCCNFSVQKVEENVVVAVGGAAAREITPGELKTDEMKKVEVEGQCAAYWTTLAPNVEEYSGTAARLIATGSGQLVKGILWCGDVTMERLKWGDDVLKKRLVPGDTAEVDPNVLKRIKRFCFVILI